MRYLSIILLFLINTNSFAAYENYFDRNNSKTDAMAALETFTGEWFEVTKYSSVIVAVKSDASGILYIQQSSSATDNPQSSIPYEIMANINEVHRLTITRKFVRIIYVNGTSPQSSLDIHTTYGSYPVLSAPLNLPIGQDADATVSRTFGYELSIAEGLFSGFSVTNKRGKNSLIDTNTVPESIWENGGVYTGFPTGALENLVLVSSSAADTGSVSIICLTSDTDEAYESYTYTLTGTTPVDTGLDVYRCHTASYNNGTDQGFNQGVITARWESTTSVIFLTIPISQSQSNAAVYTCPYNSTCFIWNVNGAIRKKTSTYVDISFWIRDYGRSPRMRVPSVMTDALKLDRHLFTGIRVNQRADITMNVTEVGANGTAVVAGFDVLVVSNSSL